MNNHFYAINGAADGAVVGSAQDVWTVGTSSDSGAPLEVRVTDAAMTREQASLALRDMADRIDMGDYSFIAAGNFTG
jgi:hypothetical protein